MSAVAQSVEQFKNAPGGYEIKIVGSVCKDAVENDFGDTSYAIYRKGESKVFQRITLSELKYCEPKGETAEITTVEYGKQNAVFVDDYNFDGLNDLAIFEGNIGGYGAPSYQIYLFSMAGNRFVKDDEFSKLSQFQGRFEINKRSKMLYVDSKDGCCFHQTEGYKVKNNKPFKVYEHTIDGSAPNGGDDPEIKTKKLINGKWQSWDRNSAATISFDKGKTSKTISVRLTENEPVKWIKIGAASGQKLTVTKNSMDADIRVVEFKGDVSYYDSYEDLQDKGQMSAKLMGNGDYFLQLSAEKNLNFNLTITIENQASDTATGASVSTKFLITPTSVGDIKFGMTVGEAGKVLPKEFRLAPAAGDEGIWLVGVYEGEKLLFTIGDYGDFQGSEDKMPPINKDQKIQVMLIFDSRFKTVEGVHVGMPIAEVEKIYGKLKKITNEPHIGQLGEFTKQPVNLEFNLSTKNNKEITVGIYEKIPNCEITDSSDCLILNYVPNSYISGMALMVPMID